MTVSNKKVLTNAGLTRLVELINGKFAPLNSPTLTGTPTAPTPNTSDDSTKVATTAFVNSRISSLSTAVTSVAAGSQNGAIAVNGVDFIVPGLDSAAYTPATDYAAASHIHASSSINALTGYEKPNTTDSLFATDTLNEALGKLEKALDGKQAAGSYLSPDSPVITGIPTVPTPLADDDSTQIANTEWVNDVVDAAIADLVNSAPATLDTLNELATALGDDPNFATTVATSLGEKVDADSPDYIKSASVNANNTLTLTKGDNTTVDFNSTIVNDFTDAEIVAMWGDETIWDATGALWNSSTTYYAGDYCTTADGSVYRCRLTSTNNPPATSPGYWAPITVADGKTWDYDVNGDMMPAESPIAMDGWDVDTNGDIMPM